MEWREGVGCGGNGFAAASLRVSRVFRGLMPRSKGSNEKPRRQIIEACSVIYRIIQSTTVRSRAFRIWCTIRGVVVWSSISRLCP